MRIVQSRPFVTLTHQLCRPGGVWQSALHPVGDVQASQQQIRTTLQRLSKALFDAVLWLLAAWLALTAGVPQAGEVGLAIGCEWRRSRSVEFPVFGPRNALSRKGDPLCIHRVRQNKNQDGAAHCRQYTGTRLGPQIETFRMIHNSSGIITIRYWSSAWPCDRILC